MWLGSERGLWRIPPGGLRATAVAGTQHLSVASLAADRHGGLWIRGSRSLEVLFPGGACRAIDSPIANATLGGLCATDDAVFAWTEQGMWRAQRDGLDIRWQQIPGLAGVRAAAADGADLVVATQRAVLRITADLQQQPIEVGNFQGVQHLVVEPDSLWIAGHQELWRIGRRGGCQPVQRFSRGQPLTLSIYVFTRDSQGLLWFGSERGVQRTTLVAGVKNFVVAAITERAGVNTLGERRDGSMVLGTESGQLLAQRHGCWHEVPLPWPRPSARPAPIEVVAEDADGALCVGTRGAGLWRLDGAQAGRIGEAQGIEHARALLVTSDRALWIADDRRVWRLASDQATPQEIPLQPATQDSRIRPCTMVADGAGRVWLGSYREGLLAYDRRTGTFQQVGEGWQGDSVMNVMPGSGTDQVWVTSTEGLWSVSLPEGDRTLIRQTARTGLFRSATTASDGTLWLTLPAQLVQFDPATNHFRTLPPRHGSHPLGYSHRSRLRRQNGDLWFGAIGGYSVIAANATSVEWPVRLGESRFEVGGVPRALTGTPPRLELAADEGPLRVVPRVVDRSLDDQPAWEVVLRKHRSHEVLGSANGDFPSLPPGRYDASVVITLPTGQAKTIGLAHLHVQQPPARWPWWTVGALAVVAATGFGSFGWRRLRRLRIQLSRRIALQQDLQLPSAAPGAHLDIAFLAVATAEECVRRSDVAHATVCLHSPERQEPTRLGEFGAPCADAEARAARCMAEGLPVRTLFRLLRHGGTDDLVSRVCDDRGQLEFVILLHRLPRVDASLLDELEAAAAPLLASLRKHGWIRRLEDDYAQKSATLEADAHDLRSPLSMLRLATFQLGEVAAQRTDPTLAAAARAVDAAAGRVLAAVDGMVHNQHQAARLQSQAMDPAALVLARIAELQPTAHRLGIRITTDGPSTVTGVSGDPVWLGRVIDNLIGNAIKYTATGTRIDIRWRETAAEFTLFVEDEGPGFTAREREAVFLPGVTGSARPQHGEAQTGMGLWIARQAVQGMGGSLWIDADHAPGARVCLSLPRRPNSGATN